MIKKLLIIAFFYIFYTTTVFANANVSIEVEDKKANITISGIEKNIKSLQIDFIDENGNTNSKFTPSKEFRYYNLKETKNGDKTTLSILIDDTSNIFQSNSLNLGKVSFNNKPNISEDVKLEIFNIDESLNSEKLTLKANITVTGNNNNNNSSSNSSTSAVIESNSLPKEDNTKEDNKVEEKPIVENKINIDEMYPIITTVTFNDISNHWAKESITYLAERGIINGVSSEEFLPNNNITRAEFVTLLAKMDKIDENKYKSEGLKDVPSNSWFSPYVDWAMKNGITSGIDSENFAPNDTITREQMAVMIKRFADYKGFSLKEINDKKYFTDQDSISDYAKEAIGIVQQSGVINGRDNGSFAPKDKATRGEASKMLYNLLTIQ